MKLLRAMLVMALLSGLLPAEDIIPSFAPGIMITYTAPNPKVWKVDSREERTAMGFVMYKRDEITDKNGATVAPTLSIIYEKLPKDVDLTEFVAYSQKQLPYPAERGPNAPNGATMLLVEYSEQGFSHVLMVGHLVLDGLGVRILFDTTLSVAENVTTDFIFFLFSVSLKKK